MTPYFATSLSVRPNDCVEETLPQATSTLVHKHNS